MKSTLLRIFAVAAVAALAPLPDSQARPGGNNNNKNNNRSSANSRSGGGNPRSQSSSRSPITSSRVSKSSSNRSSSANRSSVNRSSSNSSNRNRSSSVSSNRNSSPRTTTSNNSDRNKSQANVNRSSNNNSSRSQASNNTKPNNTPRASDSKPNNTPRVSDNKPSYTPRAGDNKPNNNNRANDNKSNKGGNNDNKPSNVARNTSNTTTNTKRPDNPRVQVNNDKQGPKPGSVNYPKVANTNQRNDNNKDNANRNEINRNNANRNDHPKKHHHPNRVTSVVNNRNVVNRWDNRWVHNDNIWGAQALHDGHYDHRHQDTNPRLGISSNFYRSVNYAYRPTAWGSRPWWGSQHCHNDWHHGSWNYGWNSRWHDRYHHYHRPRYYPPGYYYDDFDLGENLAWGLAGWSLGRLFYDTGYGYYRNPYSAPPVTTSHTTITYVEPISVVGSEDLPPESEELAETQAEKSANALAASRDWFKRGDYLAALSQVDEAISYQSGDPALHEYRALVLFALGRYGDAAGVLNPVLASGPGWDWATMIGLYSDTDTYTGQLRKLEDYVNSQEESADSRFLLGYHYMVGGHLNEAYAMFDEVTELQPADTVSKQLRNLVADSMPVDENAPVQEVVIEEPEPVILAEEQVYGVWKAQSAEGKEITLSLGSDAAFSWNYEGAKDSEVLKGEWSIDDDGLLVLADEDVQLVGQISLEADNNLRFILAGGPEGDPGLLFKRGE